MLATVVVAAPTAVWPMAAAVLASLARVELTLEEVLRRHADHQNR